VKLSLLQQRLRNLIYRRNKNYGKTLWRAENVIPGSQVNHLISDAINQAKPFLVGKIGLNEQYLIHWGLRIPIPSMAPSGTALVSGKQPNAQPMQVHALGIKRII
jgi:hypothetical protein